MKLPDHVLLDRLTFFLLGFILIFAPLFRAGNRPLPLAILIIAALILFVLGLASGRYQLQLSTSRMIALLALLIVPLCYLVPLDTGLWSNLPGREIYAQAHQLPLLLDPNSVPPSSVSLSVIPSDTVIAVLTLTLPVAVFLAAVGLPTEMLSKLLLLVLVIAAGQAVLALLQYGDGPESVLRLGNERGLANGNGTYVNRNHLAGFLNLVLPVVLGMLASTVGRNRRSKNFNQRIQFISSGSGHLAIIYAGLAILLILGVVFSRSRTGLTLLILGVLLTTLLVSRKLKTENIFGWIGTIAIAGIGLAAAVGLVPILRRFVIDDPLGIGRLVIFSNTIDGIKQFFPLGSGPGTFPKVFPRFQQPDFQGFVNHAHNDYLEWLFELGVLALCLFLVYLCFYVVRWSSLWISGHWSSFRFAQAGAGIGLLLMMIHGLSDYNLHIPANLVFFAFFAAIFFHNHQLEKDAEDRRRDRSAQDKARRRQRRPQVPAVTGTTANPFATDAS